MHTALLFAFGYLGGAALHEVAHAAMARIVGWPVYRVQLFGESPVLRLGRVEIGLNPFGTCALDHGSPYNPDAGDHIRNAAIWLADPATTLAVAVVAEGPVRWANLLLLPACWWDTAGLLRALRDAWDAARAPSWNGLP